MASLSKDKNGNVTIQFVGPDKRRRSIRLGKINAKTANEVKLKVEHLSALLAAKLPMDGETARWVAGIGDALAAKLAAVGLVPARVSRTVAEFLAEWLAGKKAASYKPTSLIAWGQTVAEFSALLGTRPLGSLSHADGEAFRDRMRGRNLRPTTVHKRLAHAKAMLEDAVRLGYISANPFRHVKQRQGDPSERRKYVPVADVQEVIAHCPNVWWKLIAALARFGGLRTPSETFSLTWGDVDWDGKRLSVPSPKTEHIGKGHRVIPLFPLLRPHLEAAFDAATEGDVFIFPEKYRKRAHGERGWNGANLRTTMEKIIRRAKVDPWPRVFHALRASHESDLATSFPLAVVTKWLGNTPSVALKHYIDATDTSFEQAAGWTPSAAKSGAVALRKPVQTGADAAGPDPTRPAGVLGNQGKSRILSDPVEYCPDVQRECMGIEPTGGLIQTPRRF